MKIIVPFYFFPLSFPSALPKTCRVSEESFPEPISYFCRKTTPQINCLEALSQRLVGNLWTHHWRVTLRLWLSPKTPSWPGLAWPVRWSFLSRRSLMMTALRKQRRRLIHRSPVRSHPRPPRSYPKLCPWRMVTLPHRTQLTILPALSHCKGRSQVLLVMLTVDQRCSLGTLHRQWPSYPPRWDISLHGNHFSHSITVVQVVYLYVCSPPIEPVRTYIHASCQLRSSPDDGRCRRQQRTQCQTFI